MKRYFFTLALCVASVLALGAKSSKSGIAFADYFSGQTLRVDYQFFGNNEQQGVVLDGLSNTGVWAGRHHNLDQIPLLGNGQVEMKDEASGKVIYRTSFSSLFLEWISTDEAHQLSRSFEHTVLLPMPLAKTQVTVTLIDAEQKVTAKYVHTVDPADILIAQKHRNPDLDYAYIHKGGSVERSIDVAILAEGYDASERDLFYADAREAAKALFSHEPFASRSGEFNIVAVFTPSRQSGMSVPRLGEWKDTAFDSHFSTFYSDRYLTTTSIKKMHDAIAGVMYEHIIILANTEEYGGGGIYNDYTLTTAHNPMFAPVVVHEFGHSFGGLADEYTYGDPETYDTNVEPWEQNITSMKNFKSKWADMVKKGTPVPTPATEQYTDGTVGAFEGAGYNETGLYRPCFNCRMRTNDAPAFCPVCQRAIARIIDFYTK